MVAGWIIIGVVAVVFLIAVFKSQDLVFVFALIKKNFFLILFILVVLFISFSMYHLHSSYDINLTSFAGFKAAGNVYLTWMKSVFSNMGRITGYAVNQDWVLANSTNISSG